MIYFTSPIKSLDKAFSGDASPVINSSSSFEIFNKSDKGINSLITFLYASWSRHSDNLKLGSKLTNPLCFLVYWIAFKWAFLIGYGHRLTEQKCKILLLRILVGTWLD